MTAHEKAVQAAAKKLVSVRLSLPMTFAEQSSAAITAYLASMEAQGWVMVEQPVSTTSDTRIAELEAEVERLRAGPKVKQLEWGRDYVNRTWHGNTPAANTGRAYIVKDNGAWSQSDGKWVMDQAGDVEAAKAAAQKDYEMRIYSALEIIENAQ